MIVALMLGTLAVVDAAAAPGLTETALECALTVSGFAAMAVWVRRNRAGLDCRDWCACASAQVHIRVIRSQALEPRVEARGESAPVTELEEVAWSSRPVLTRSGADDDGLQLVSNRGLAPASQKNE